MNRDETKQIIGVIIASYPNYKPIDIGLTVDTWNLMLSDYSFTEVQMALKTFITTDSSGFAPSIGQLIDKIHGTREMVTEQSNMAVWDKVRKAIGNATYHSQEEFEKLDDITKQVIGSSSALRQMAMNEDFNEDVEKALFMKAYNQRLSRQKELNRMPSELRIAIEQNMNNNNLLEG